MIKIDLPEHVKKIISVLEESGYEAYAVGGCVRDSLLGKEPKDWDITTSAKPFQVKELFYKTIDTGIAHGTVTVMISGVGYEVTTYRIDGEYEDGRHPKEVVFTGNLTEDLKRRDFTINAMAYSDRSGIVDEFDGVGDLKRGVIRCVGVPEERFHEDALRILRAVRFSAVLDFAIEEQTWEAVCNLSSTLQKISRERIQTELDKLLTSDHPDRVTELERAGILQAVFEGEPGSPSAAAEDRCDNRPAVTGEEPGISGAARRLMNTPKDHFLRWGVFISCIPYQHVLKGLKFDNQTIRICEILKKFKDIPLKTDKPYLRHLAVQIGVDYMEKYYFPYRRAMENVDPELLLETEAVFSQMREDGDCMSMRTLAVKGRDLLEIGIPSGAKMGEILNGLFELVLNDASMNRRDVLLAEARKRMGYCN